MNANMKKKKISVLRIILCAFIIVFIVVFLIIIKMKMEGIHILSGSVTTTFLDTEYDDRTFLISVGGRLYMDPFLDINDVKSKYNVTIEEGDSICAVCKVDSKEIAPAIITIYYIFRL